MDNPCTILLRDNLKKSSKTLLKQTTQVFYVSFLQHFQLIVVFFLKKLEIAGLSAIILIHKLTGLQLMMVREFIYLT
jgi:uncharacterized membrane-anchored protein